VCQVSKPTAFETDPHAAIPILLDGCDIFTAGNIRSRIDSKFAILHPDEAAVAGANPQSRIAAFIQHFDVIDLDSAGVRALEDIEVEPIEPCQTSLCSHPEKAVTRLKDRLHGILGEAFWRLPCLVAVALDR